MSKNLIKACLFTPTPAGWGIPLTLIGSPATCKTSLIEETCEDYGLPCQVLSPGESGEGAFGVVPVPDRNAEGNFVLRYPAPEWVERIGERGVVFVDEMNTAAPAYQPALLGLMLARRIGGHYLGRGVRMVAALNPPETSRNVWELSPALANRLCHVQWTAPSGEAWDDWLLGMTPGNEKTERKVVCSASVEEARVLEAWPAAAARAKQLVTGFRKVRPDALHREPKIDDPNSGGAWASRRSWTLATCALIGSTIHGLSTEERQALLVGCVGEATAIEFLAWATAQDLPDPVAVLDGKLSFTHNPLRLDITMAVLNGCAALVTAPSTDKTLQATRLAAMWEVLANVTADGSAHDLCVPVLRRLSKAKAMPRGGMASLATKTIASLKPALEAAGML